MPEFHVEKDGERLSVVSGDWSFCSDTPAPGLFTFKMEKNGISLESLPAQLGDCTETFALAERRRPHLLSGGKEISLECSGTIPFGSSPGISRKYRFFENEMLVVSDFILRHSFPMKRILAGGLKFSGPFLRFGIQTAPEKEEDCLVVPPAVQWTAFPLPLPGARSSSTFQQAAPGRKLHGEVPCGRKEENTLPGGKKRKDEPAEKEEEKEEKRGETLSSSLYCSPAPPLAFLLEYAAEGKDVKKGKEKRHGGRTAILRFRIGEDFWRWIHAARLGGESSFSIVRNKEGEILFTWNLLEWKGKTEDEEAPPGRNWRLSWSLDWGSLPLPAKPEETAAARKISPASFRAVFDMESYPWKADALCRDAEGHPQECCPCASSASVLNALKRWLRSCLCTASEGDVYAVLNAKTHFCFSAAHRERPKLKSLAHWDAAPLEEFCRWANRQLAPSGAKLVIVEKSELQTHQDSVPFSPAGGREKKKDSAEDC